MELNKERLKRLKFNKIAGFTCVFPEIRVTMPLSLLAIIDWNTWSQNKPYITCDGVCHSTLRKARVHNRSNLHLPDEVWTCDCCD